ncbi:hypothetical protein BGZ74_011632 [Mortierella antarctica]|nr:hypothetical protein BGZ74_011632 [Mortierella antarctica]
MSDSSGFPSGMYPQPIGSFSGGASSSTASGASLPLLGTSTLPKATTYVGGQQFPTVSASGITNLAAAAAAAAAISSPKKAAAGAGAAATKTGKRPYKKSGANSKRGGGGGGGRGGGSAGGQGVRAGGGGAGGSGGGGDGDKDSDDDEDEPEVSIEEQFILRLPPGEMCDRFREKVIAREIDESVNLKFKDSRRGTFMFEGLIFPTKLVDLPNIIEAQKTLNGKQMYKIADISQMLIIDGTPEPQPPRADGSFSGLPLPPMKPSEYTWPDGLSMALKNVRRRRFRKRVSKAAVEGVENEIERLLHEDALAEEVQYDIREQVDGMEEGMDQFDFSDDGEGMGATPAPDEGGNQNSDMDMMYDEEMMEEEEEEEEDDDEADEMMDEFQRDLEREMEKNSSGEDEDDGNGTPTPKPTSQPQKPGANAGTIGAESSSSSAGAVKSGSAGSNLPNLHAMQIDIRNASGSGTASSMAASGAGLSSRTAEKQKKSEDEEDEDDEEEDDEEDDDEEDEDDDDDDSGSDEDDDDDEDDKEKAQLEKMLKDEIKELNGKIRENQDKLNSAPNEILKKRFGSILDTLRKELELKTMQLEETKEHAKDKKKQ